MDALYYSFIIPVFNRPDEIKELLQSFKAMESDIPFEIVIIEDGSTIDCRTVVKGFEADLNISYYNKPNSGPGDSRNFGMRKARGNYFIILDSDCLLPSQYLSVVNTDLEQDYVDCFGGPDAADESFTNLQKAINFAMTSFITTGGIRGSKSKNKKFQPRSFNMGISKTAFEASGGFGYIHPGEDPDLSIRLIKLGFKTKLINNAFVYHKRRISWSKFYQQVHKFGLVRPILNLWHPNSERLIFWLPSLFCLGLIFAAFLTILGNYFLLSIFSLYMIFAFLVALFQTKSVVIAIQAVFAIFVQFFGYGLGFLKSTFAIKVLKKKPEAYYPNLFFNNAV
ncbi:glycosyltransferase [Psychroserpens ponticola]|uniref:Glycosyltransferase n=1 Tax=Psychroserpens ponticola TaxID=2932268 RepID=A0ABY7RTS7_9FLAO|nr:glycosyltransferase [Psychroserpens ponticola]WCO00507.1 glycosyltransferase [Psychroserpens ponticola]